MKITKWGYGYRHSEEFLIDRPRGSGDFMFLVLKSRAWFELDGGRTEAKADSVILYEKGIPQRYGALHGEFINDWIHFEANENDLALWKRLAIPTNRPIPLCSCRSLSELIRSICDEMHGGGAYAEETAGLYGTMIWYRLAELCRLDQPRELQAHYERLKQIRHAIYRHPERSWSVDVLAKDAAMSRSYFQHLYTNFFGVCVSADIQESRISHAKYLLMSTEESVARIAEQSGYRNDVHFMRQFRKITGMRPTEFRRIQRR